MARRVDFRSRSGGTFTGPHAWGRVGRRARAPGGGRRCRGCAPIGRRQGCSAVDGCFISREGIPREGRFRERDRRRRDAPDAESTSRDRRAVRSHVRRREPSSSSRRYGQSGRRCVVASIDRRRRRGALGIGGREVRKAPREGRIERANADRGCRVRGGDGRSSIARHFVGFVPCTASKRLPERTG